MWSRRRDRLASHKGVACAGLAVGQTAEVKGTIQSDGSVLAARIQVEANENDQED
jgi:hypothetical protein